LVSCCLSPFGTSLKTVLSYTLIFATAKLQFT
jgi:hypothetical protein